jgi:hypothetical protein
VSLKEKIQEVRDSIKQQAVSSKIILKAKWNEGAEKGEKLKESHVKKIKNIKEKK